MLDHLDCSSKNHTDITKTHLVPVTPDFAIHLPYLKSVKEMGNIFVSFEEANPFPWCIPIWEACVPLYMIIMIGNTSAAEICDNEMMILWNINFTFKPECFEKSQIHTQNAPNCIPTSLTNTKSCQVNVRAIPADA